MKTILYSISLAACLGLAVNAAMAAEPETKPKAAVKSAKTESQSAPLDVAAVQQQLASKDSAERAKAREALEKAAAEDAAMAGIALGNGWLQGLFSDDPDAAKAIEWWTKSAEAGNANAWWLLGTLYRGDYGFEDIADATKATDAIRKAAEGSDANAYIPLAQRLLNGIGCEANLEEGEKWIERAIQSGQLDAWAVAARYYHRQGRDDKAIPFLRNGVEGGNPTCMYDLAAILAQKESSEDQQEAVQLIEDAADVGLIAAVRDMVTAEMAVESPRKLKIYEWLQKAALQGDALLQQELGTLHYNGWFTGVREPAAAAYWLATAARAGLPQAQYLFGNQLEKGDGVPRDYQAAFAHFKAAMDQGHPGATLGYARYLPEGGYPQDAKPDLARAWAVAKLAKDRAEAVKDARMVNAASAYIGSVSEQMEPEQFAEAKKVYTELEQDEKARLAAIAKRQEEAKAAAEKAENAAAEKEAKKAVAAEQARKAENEALGLPEGAIPLGTIPAVDELPPGE